MQGLSPQSPGGWLPAYHYVTDFDYPTSLYATTRFQELRQVCLIDGSLSLDRVSATATYLSTCVILNLPTRRNISQTFWHRLPIFQVDLHCVLHRVATSSCRRHADELATEPFLLLHREHGTGYRRSWNRCDRRTCFVVIWKHFCFILLTGTRIRIDSVMRPRSSSMARNISASVTVTVWSSAGLRRVKDALVLLKTSAPSDCCYQSALWIYLLTYLLIFLFTRS